jgi:RNA polymerase sigma factor (sigma-70 family)
MTARTEPLLRHIRRWACGPEIDSGSDAALLERFIRRREEAAFAALLARHGPMVHGVCRRVLRDVQEAEDVFQATFLVLARKAASLRHPDRLAAWLHVTARQLALKSLRAAVRRRQREKCGASINPTASADPLDELSARELLQVLDEELQRLPEVYRLPLLLCGLEGRTQEEAARLLGWTPGSVKGRLERGRERLQARLVRRGLSLSAALLAIEASRGAAEASAALTRATLQATLRSVEDSGGVCVDVGMHHWSAFKMKLVLAATLTVAVVAVGAGVVARREVEPVPTTAAEPPKPREEKQVRKDLYGDPLPPQALMRLGTVRLRHGAFRFAFSPDGQRIASAGTDGLVRIWSTATGAEVDRLGGHHGAAYSVAYSPDGKTIATGDVYDIHLWDAATGKNLRKLAGFDGGKDFKKPRGGWTVGIYSLAFSPDGKLLAAGEGDVRISLWDAASGEPRGTLAASGADVITFLPDGQRLLSAKGGTVHLWSVGGKELRAVEVGSSFRRMPLALAPDGKSFAAGPDRDITQSDGMIRYVIRSEGTVSLWDIAANKERHRLDVPHQVLAVAISPDGNTLAYSQDQTIHLLDVASWKEGRRIDIAEGRAFNLAFSPDGQVLAASCRSDLQLWNVATGRPLLRRAGHSAAVDTVSFLDGGKRLLSTCRETGIARVWDVDSGRQLHTFAGDWSPLGVVALSADGKLLASAGQFNRMSIWDTAAGQRVRLLQVEKAPPSKYAHDIRQLALSQDGRRLTSISNNNTGDRAMTILVQDAATGEQRSRLTEPILEKPSRATNAPTLSPDGRVMAQTAGRTIRVRDVSSGELLRSLQPEKLQADEILINAPTFSKDGRLLACVSTIQSPSDRGPRGKGNKLHLWELATGKEVGCFPVPFALAGVFSPDGHMLASASDPADMRLRDTPIRLWDAITGEEVGLLEGHGTFAASLAFAPDGQALATGLTHSTVLLWDLQPAWRRIRQALPAVRSEDLPRLWAELGGEDTRKAQASLWALAGAPTIALPFLERRLEPARAADPERLRRLLAELDSEQFTVRKAAFEELRKLDQLAEPALRRALEAKPSLEGRRRIDELRAEMRGPAVTDDTRRMVRAVAVLEHMNGDDARRLLAKLAGGAPEARLTREARAAMERLTLR